MDIQAERRNTQRERERADAAELEIQRLKRELEKYIEFYYRPDKKYIFITGKSESGK